MKEIERAVARDLSFLRKEIQEERRVAIPSDTKKSVYERANGRCESCGKPMEIANKAAQFHHQRKTYCQIKIVYNSIFMC